MHPNASETSGWSRAAVAGVVTLVVLSFASCIACLVWAATSPPSGVLTGNQLGADARELIRERELVREDERLLVYYDASISLDGSDVALVTDRAVVHVVNGNLTRFALREVRDIEVTEGDLNTDFVVVHESGERLRFDIASFNGEHLFTKTLMDAWARANEPTD